MIKRRIDSSLSGLYLTNNIIAWKGLEALLRETKPKQTARENRPVKRGVKANQIRKGEREIEPFRGQQLKRSKKAEKNKKPRCVLLFTFQHFEYYSNYRKYFHAAQGWPQIGNIHLRLGENMCLDKNTAPNFAVLTLHLLKLCLSKGKQTPSQGHKNHKF